MNRLSRHTMRWACLWCMLCAMALLAPSVGHAQERAIHWERYDINVAVESDGTMRVVETQHLVIDSGTYRTGSRSFATGAFGRIRSISVSEDGQPYKRGTDDPGTYVAGDNGEQFSLAYVFRDPDRDRTYHDHCVYRGAIPERRWRPGLTGLELLLFGIVVSTHRCWFTILRRSSPYNSHRKCKRRPRARMSPWPRRTTAGAGN